MKIRRREGQPEKPSLQMTAMIDIVFLLLVFFVMTFRVTLPEGDFQIKMPAAARQLGPPSIPVPPIKVRLRASTNGTLAGITLNDRDFKGNFDALHNHLVHVVGDERGPGSVAETAEVELDCDYDLQYENVIKAITAVSGYLTDDGHVVKLIEKIKFARPKKHD